MVFLAVCCVLCAVRRWWVRGEQGGLQATEGHTLDKGSSRQCRPRVVVVAAVAVVLVMVVVEWVPQVRRGGQRATNLEKLAKRRDGDAKWWWSGGQGRRDGGRMEGREERAEADADEDEDEEEEEEEGREQSLEVMAEREPWGGHV